MSGDLANVVSIGLRVRSNLIAMLDEFESDENLSGLCAIASIGMMKSLHRHGIKSELVEGYWRKERHVWNLLRGKLVDLTLTDWSEADYQPLAVWDSIQKASDETWVSEVKLDWRKIIVVPSFAHATPRTDPPA